MIPPSQAARRLLQRCPIQLQEQIPLLVRRQTGHNTSPADVDLLVWEVRRSFEALTPPAFEDPRGAARLIFALLQGLAWKRYADLLGREEGRRRPSSCQWFEGIRGTGSFCKKENPPLPLSQPERCPKLPCFAPVQAVALDPQHEPKSTPPSEGSLEAEQIRQKLGLFLEQSPVLADLFCAFLEADPDHNTSLKETYSQRFSVSIRTIENWRQRATTLFLCLYTGALEQLAQHHPTAHQAITLRDFNPRLPLPSEPLPYGTLGQQLHTSRAEARQLHHQGWLWMQEWMAENGYPEARQLHLPFKEKPKERQEDNHAC